MLPEEANYRPRLPTGRKLLVDALLWCGIFLVVATVATALHLPQRMQCAGAGRYAHCKHGLLSPELWRGQ
jgi:hypothetical protein